MAKYETIKKQASDKYTELQDKCELFWAFSNEQFAEGKAKHPVNPGEKYTSIGAGGYLPNKNVQMFIDGQKAIEKWRKAEIKKAKTEEVILHELKNYEAFYIGDIEEAAELLMEMGFTLDQIKAVYHKHREEAIQ